MMKPVKKFINLNEQTQFEKIQPSIIQKKEMKSLIKSQERAAANQNKELVQRKVFGQRDLSAPSYRPISPNASTLQSLNASYINQSTFARAMANLDENQSSKFNSLVIN